MSSIYQNHQDLTEQNYCLPKLFKNKTGEKIAHHAVCKRGEMGLRIIKCPIRALNNRVVSRFFQQRHELRFQHFLPEPNVTRDGTRVCAGKAAKTTVLRANICFLSGGTRLHMLPWKNISVPRAPCRRGYFKMVKQTRESRHKIKQDAKLHYCQKKGSCTLLVKSFRTLEWTWFWFEGVCFNIWSLLT